MTQLGLTPEGPDPLLNDWADNFKLEGTIHQDRLDAKLAVSTLRVYVAAISAQHVRVGNQTVGSHSPVTHFHTALSPIVGAQRQMLPQLMRVPLWNFVNRLLIPWGNTAFLLAITSAKVVGELHALSVSQACMSWNTDGSGVTLWPNPSFLPKTMSASHANQCITLAAYDPTCLPGDGDERAVLLCPVRALRRYMEAMSGFRQSDSLSVTADRGGAMPCLNRGCPTGLWKPSLKHTRPRACPCPLMIKAIPPGVSPHPGRH
ncbi:hypothetical protein N1851_014055 [Merluccius polli]|uniref:Uncharacterized protein n=1 Tax=Merluccius polli TaxID=89951 RepID=A0AA47P4P4_MERPO|nr:hypothetical protein N1851_014055 [Merluccius polli]